MIYTNNSQSNIQQAGNSISRPCLRLKHGKRISKCQVFFYSTRKTQKFKLAGALCLKWGTLLEFLTSIVAKHQKLKGTLWRKIFAKKVTKKFRNKVLENFSRKKREKQCRKNWKWGPFSLARYCMLRGKQEKTFWFSSPCEMVQFDTIIFRRTFEEFFWTVRVDWKNS